MEYTKDKLTRSYAMTTKTSPEPVAEQPAPKVVHEPRNFLVTFLLASFGGYLGLRHFYLGNTTLGWLRSGLFVGGYILMFVALLAEQNVMVLVSILAISVAALWALVDFFYVFFAVKFDAEGQALVATARDKKWATVLFWVSIASALLFVAGYAVLMAVALSNPSLNPYERSNYSNESLYWPTDGVY